MPHRKNSGSPCCKHTPISPVSWNWDEQKDLVSAGVCLIKNTCEENYFLISLLVLVGCYSIILSLGIVEDEDTTTWYLKWNDKCKSIAYYSKSEQCWTGTIPLSRMECWFSIRGLWEAWSWGIGGLSEVWMGSIICWGLATSGGLLLIDWCSETCFSEDLWSWSAGFKKWRLTLIILQKLCSLKQVILDLLIRFKSLSGGYRTIHVLCKSK